MTARLRTATAVRVAGIAGLAVTICAAGHGPLLGIGGPGAAALALAGAVLAVAALLAAGAAVRRLAVRRDALRAGRVEGVTAPRFDRLSLPGLASALLAAQLAAHMALDLAGMDDDLELDGMLLRHVLSAVVAALAVRLVERRLAGLAAAVAELVEDAIRLLRARRPSPAGRPRTCAPRLAAGALRGRSPPALA